MITAAKNYVVEDAEPGVSSGIPAATFPATLTGLLDALGAARYRSAAAGAAMALIVIEGSQRQPIRRFAGTNTNRPTSERCTEMERPLR